MIQHQGPAAAGQQGCGSTDQSCHHGISTRKVDALINISVEHAPFSGARHSNQLQVKAPERFPGWLQPNDSDAAYTSNTPRISSNDLSALQGEQTQHTPP